MVLEDFKSFIRSSWQKVEGCWIHDDQNEESSYLDDFSSWKVFCWKQQFDVDRNNESERQESSLAQRRQNKWSGLIYDLPITFS